MILPFLGNQPRRGYAVCSDLIPAYQSEETASNTSLISKVIEAATKAIDVNSIRSTHNVRFLTRVSSPRTNATLLKTHGFTLIKSASDGRADVVNSPGVPHGDRITRQ